MELIEIKNTLIPKLVKVLGEITRLKKTGRNDFHKYDYATEADILDAVRSKLSDNGIFIFTSQESVSNREVKRIDKNNQEKISISTSVKMKHTFTDGSGYFEVFSFGESEDTGDKGLYKAVTGAMKYFISKNFLISTGDDPETGSPEEKGERKPATKSHLTEWEEWSIRQVNRAGSIDQLDMAVEAIKQKGPNYWTARVRSVAEEIFGKMEKLSIENEIPVSAKGTK